MTTCTDNVCGTGQWTGPKPGDPDSTNVVLQATPAVGGVELRWSYPAVNPAAVAHVKVYRGPSANFAQAAERAIVNGSFYFDRITDAVPVMYFYWIRVISVNGTIGDLIGPASATPRTLQEGTLESLTGMIDAGLLAQSLREDIDRIIILNGDLQTEIGNRLLANTALSDALSAVQSDVDAAMTLIQTEVTQRTSSDEALVSELSTLAAGLGDNAAAIINESTARATADDAMASDITILYAETADNSAAILNEQTVRSNADGALTTAVNAAYAAANNAGAAVVAETTARVAADNALSSQITTVQSGLNNDLASVQTTLSTEIQTLDGVVTSIGALYTAKVQVNGLIGGFGVYNDGTEVQAGFDVDTFWVGRTGPDKVKPFIISGGIVYIDIARIRDADITTLKIAGEAVTVPRSAYTAGNQNTGTSWTDVQSLYFDTADVPVIVMGKVTGFHGNEGSYTDYEVRLLDPVGNVIDIGGGRVEGVQASGVAIAVMGKSMGAGTYKLQAKGDLGTTNPVGARSLVLIGCKR